MKIFLPYLFLILLLQFENFLFVIWIIYFILEAFRNSSIRTLQKNFLVIWKSMALFLELIDDDDAKLLQRFPPVVDNGGSSLLEGPSQ